MSKQTVLRTGLGYEQPRMLIPLGRTPLHLAAWACGQGPSGRQKFYGRFFRCDYPLETVTKEEMQDMIRLLIDHGSCDPMSLDKYGQSFYQYWSGPSEIFAWLKRKEAIVVDVSDADDVGGQRPHSRCEPSPCRYYNTGARHVTCWGHRHQYCLLQRQ